MRLWSLHPLYLDPKGLVALWREALLAKAVLSGQTRGYKHHPQLQRFREHDSPLDAISNYLYHVYQDAARRGYSFDRAKVGGAAPVACIPVTTGQLAFERDHLQCKLQGRCPAAAGRLRSSVALDHHPLFTLVEGPVESWERL